MSSDYPSDWNSRRKSVYERDDHICQNCGTDGGLHTNIELHAHHVVPKSRGGTHDMSNLITLCSQCHKTVHSKNTHAPTGYQEHEQEFTHSNPDFGDLADSILDDTYTIVSGAGSLLISTSNNLDQGSLEFEEVSEVQNELRIAIISTYEHIDLLRSSSTLDYSSDLVNAVEMCVDEAEKTLIVVMNTLDLIEECIFDLFDQVTSCPSCGTSIEESDAFCGGCGSNLSEMIPSCPECNNEVSIEDEFCRKCGEELSSHQGPILGTAQVSLDWHDRMEKNTQQLDDAIKRYVIAHKNVDIKLRIQSETFTNAVWRYCPSCGFPEGALRTMKGIECVVCNDEWKDKGIISKKIEMTKGDIKGKSLVESKWERLGKQRNKQKHFQEILFPDPFFEE